MLFWYCKCVLNPIKFWDISFSKFSTLQSPFSKVSFWPEAQQYCGTLNKQSHVTSNIWHLDIWQQLQKSIFLLNINEAHLIFCTQGHLLPCYFSLCMCYVCLPSAPRLSSSSKWFTFRPHSEDRTHSRWLKSFHKYVSILCQVC